MKTIIVVIIIGLLVVIWYISNIVKLIGCDFSSPYKCEVIRTVWIFIPPVWVVTWYISIND